MFEDFCELKGKTFSRVEREGDSVVFENDEIIYTLKHDQDCCERVEIEDICGDLDCLVGAKILLAEEATNREKPKDRYDESYTWTFYKLSTIKGDVTIRFYGSSNGWYGESASLRSEERTKWQKE